MTLESLLEGTTLSLDGGAWLVAILYSFCINGGSSMTVFTSLLAARRMGFRWLEFVESYQLHRVEKDFLRDDGKRVKMLAWARP